MKKCLQCEQVYGDDTNFCLSDGSTLVPVSGSYASTSETPTVFRGAAPPTVYSGGSTSQFTPPTSYSTTPQAEPKKNNTILLTVIVGLLALIVGGAVVGLAVYGLNSSDKSDKSDKKDTNAANASTSPDKTSKTATPDQKSNDENLAQNLKEQQDKLSKERQKLEDERKALETKKQQTPQTPKPPSSSTATVFNPPTNIRSAPNGSIVCVVRQRTNINILGSTGVSDNNGTWYYTDACGGTGVIHSSQIRF